jgi:hypothetical protein
MLVSDSPVSIVQSKQVVNFVVRVQFFCAMDDAGVRGIRPSRYLLRVYKFY